MAKSSLGSVSSIDIQRGILPRQCPIADKYLVLSMLCSNLTVRLRDLTVRFRNLPVRFLNTTVKAVKHHLFTTGRLALNFETLSKEAHHGYPV